MTDNHDAEPPAPQAPPSRAPRPRKRLTRRDVLFGAAGVGGAAAIAGISWAVRPRDPHPATPAGPDRISPSADAVERVEAARRARGTGRSASAALTAEECEVDLGGRVVKTWAYNQQIPGPVVRCTAGDELSVELTNRLHAPTTVHWHGLRLRNDMDGVPHLTQDPVPAGETMHYRFIAPDPGTYWLHPHVGLQRERGLYAPLLIDDPQEPGDYDVEFVVVLDDWIDGTVATPDEVLDELRHGGMGATYRTPIQDGKIADHSDSWQYHTSYRLSHPPKGMHPAHPATRLVSSVRYPFYLLNGRMPSDPQVFRARAGQRARIRLINAGGATAFRVALGDHRLTVTHTDGFPIEPVTVDTLQIASGERYDLTVTLDDGVFPLVAVAEGKGAQAFGIVRTAGGRVPPATASPHELAGRLLDLKTMQAAEAVRFDPAEPDVILQANLTGDMGDFAWRINAEGYDHDHPFTSITPLVVHEGQRVRLDLLNQTPMYHPMHLHGHTFAVRSISDTAMRTSTDLPRGTRKDSLMVPPGERVSTDLLADNPGQWLLHCHNAYHMATGMATIMSYEGGAPKR